MKQAGTLGAALMVTAVLAPGPTRAGAGPAPTVGGCQLFPEYTGAIGAPSAADQTAWNQDVSATSKDPRSKEYMQRIRKLEGSQSLHPDFGGNGEYGIPFEVVPAAEPLIDVTIGEDGYPDESEFGAGTTGPDSAPVPLDTAVEGGA